VRLSTFAIFAFYSAVSMLQSARATSLPGAGAAQTATRGDITDSPLGAMPPSREGPVSAEREGEIPAARTTLYVILFGVGALTAVIGTCLRVHAPTPSTCTLKVHPQPTGLVLSLLAMLCVHACVCVRAPARMCACARMHVRVCARARMRGHAHTCILPLQRCLERREEV